MKYFISLSCLLILSNLGYGDLRYEPPGSSGANPVGSAGQVEYYVNPTTFGGAAGMTIDANGNPVILDTNGAHTSFLVGNTTFSIVGGSIGIGTANPNANRLLDIFSSNAISRLYVGIDGGVVIGTGTQAGNMAYMLDVVGPVTGTTSGYGARINNSGTNESGALILGNTVGLQSEVTGGGTGLVAQADTSGTAINLRWGVSSGSNGSLMAGRPFGNYNTSQFYVESYSLAISTAPGAAFFKVNLNVNNTGTNTMDWMTLQHKSVEYFGIRNDGSVVSAGSVVVAGNVLNGYEQITNSCGAGVTTCTATCSAGKQATGCGVCSVASVAGLSVMTGGSSGTSSCTCTSLAATTISASVYCARTQ